MSDRWRLGRLGRRLAGAILLVAASSLTVLFVGTVVPHLVADPPHPHSGPMISADGRVIFARSGGKYVAVDWR